MNLTKTLTAVSFMLAATTATAQNLEELTVAYFLEWPTPNIYAKTNKIFEKELGIPVNWVSFDTGTAMSAAMASGDVHISFSQGITPFLVATAAGQDLQIVDIAVTYSDSDNCVVRAELEITKDNVEELKGLQVGVPLGTAAHSGFLAQIKHFGLSDSDFKIVDMAPVDSAAAFAAGEMDMVCGWGGPLHRMKEYGNILIGGAEKEAVVGRVYDVTSIPREFGEENPELLAQFLSITAKMNAMYAEDPESMIEDISKGSGIGLFETQRELSVFGFPTLAEQISDKWMDGWLANDLKRLADKLEAGGKIKALNDYTSLVDSSFLEEADKILSSKKSN